MITIHLPEDLQQYVQAEVQSGRFASPDEAISDALRLHRQKRQAPPSPRQALTPDELNRQMLEAGLLSKIPVRPDPTDYQAFPPIAIEGEPLSETIIRERR